MPTHISLPALWVTEHSFEIPLDHEHPEGRKLTVFAREVADPGGRDRPFLVYFQGGPGFEDPRPTSLPRSPGWLGRALSEFRVLMLDQRGTGRSSPVGQLEGMTATEQADYLKHFRADAIVRDAEWIRDALGVERWSVLGQSFGGFCVLSYLSMAPEGLREALITGGVPTLSRHIDDVYTRTYQRVRERNRRYFERYPDDRRRLAELRRWLEGETVQIPNGDRLTWRRFRQVGLNLGMSDGAEQIHYLLELPFDSPGFLHDAQEALGFARNPIYAILHEASWANGLTTAWSAERLLPAEFEDSELLTGEHVFPWMFEDYGALSPLREAADILAHHAWPRLYDPEVLRTNRIPTAAVVYLEDMYVESTFSEETLAELGASRAWFTNEYEHNGLRVDGERILDRLLELARGRR